MNRIILRLFGITFAALLLHCGVSRGASGEGAATGNGRVVITRQPQALRMQVTLSADGKDIADAVAKMKEQETALGKKLAELGASEKSVEFGATQVGNGARVDPQQQYVQAMLARQRGRGAKPSTQPVSVGVSATVKAEWALKAGSPEELLIASYALQEKIKAAATVKKEMKATTPEEQEAMEEAVAMQVNNGGVTAGPGDPSFLYVCKVSEADRAAALAEAFQKAKSEAARLAKAAGTELGALKQLTAAVSAPGGADNEQQAYMRMSMRQMGMNSPEIAEPNADEATAPIAGPLELQIVVTATFNLK